MGLCFFLEGFGNGVTAARVWRGSEGTEVYISSYNFNSIYKGEKRYLVNRNVEVRGSYEPKYSCTFSPISTLNFGYCT